MNDIDIFLSKDDYLYLPTKNNPKVVLTVGNASLAKNAFRLYNPFSTKAKFFKYTVEAAFTHFNVIAKRALICEKKRKSRFIEELEKKLNVSLVSSVYFATAKDKVVLQLQTPDAQLLGYLKFPLSDIGIEHLLNEKRAIDTLSKKSIVQRYRLFDDFEGRPFLLLEPLDGKIGRVEKEELTEILKKFHRSETYALKHHPRIMAMREEAGRRAPEYLSLLDTICRKSSMKYRLVYEHGDFAPWNIVKVGNELIPFDFEYFVEDGLEHFDLIKYYYQIGKLLKAKEGEALYAFVKESMGIVEFDELFALFLLKEIVRQMRENEDCEFERKLLERVVER